MPAPPISALEQLRKLDPTLVQTVQERFLVEANQNPSQYDSNDVRTIAANKWQIERFLLESKLDPDLATRQLQQAMQWRHQQQVTQLRVTHFPAEYYQSGYIVQFGRDRNGATVITIRINIHRKVNDWNQLLKMFFLYQIEQIDLNNDGKGVTLLMDGTGVGMSNLDLDLLKFIVTSFSQYYPKLFDSIIIHELPYLLQYVFKLVQSWLPEEDRKFFHLTTKKTLTDFIAPEQLASFIGNDLGKAEGWNGVPDGVLPAEQFVQCQGERFGLKANAADKLKYLQPYIR